ncbi:hypothetical protein M2371_000643 [Buttiauxella sp. BIGb0471]|uniref:DUF4225 domain-containing protein n=1 Tax=Buttiauxella sp. BIGb0471 TaxID=2940597 RepID=UPI00216A2B27|nr:DUF4225 domain-containing protein [Buttiauxella sp. BIGb0471]MCS3601457.1 hypothetical protein [Buttiauxella sp. BIGb0471]
MGTSAISHLKYDMDNYVVALKRVANLAASFFLEDAIIRMNYLKEIDDYIIEMNYRFHQTLDPNERMRIVNDVKAEADMAEREYQILRLGDYTKYFSTEIFEEQGVLKYVKIAGGVVAGGAQILSGYFLNKTGSQLNSKLFKTVGVTLAAHGANNVYESISPILFEHAEAGYLRKFYRKGANVLGYDNDTGDWVYSAADLAVTIFAAFESPVLIQNRNRLVPKGWFETPGSGRLFRMVEQDNIPKWQNMTKPMRLFQKGNAGYKVTTELLLGGYKYQGD